MPESTMLRFVQILPQVSSRGDFTLKDLPGSGKRIDVLCRDLAACFDWGPVIWPIANLELIAVIEDAKVLTFVNPQEQKPLGEIGWASVIRESLRGNNPEFVDVAEGTLEGVILKLNRPTVSRLWVLDEEGTSITDNLSFQQTTQNSFMLGDHRGFDSRAVNLISKHDLPRVSLGKKSYLSSHCLAAIISEFERMVS